MSVGTAKRPGTDEFSSAAATAAAVSLSAPHTAPLGIRPLINTHIEMRPFSDLRDSLPCHSLRNPFTVTHSMLFGGWELVVAFQPGFY